MKAIRKLAKSVRKRTGRLLGSPLDPGEFLRRETIAGAYLRGDGIEIGALHHPTKAGPGARVKYVINTHHHGDHSGGNARLQQLNVQVVASEQAREHMVDAKQPGLPNITVDRRAQIYLGGKKVEIHYFGRAHTSGDVVAYFPAHRTLAAGDMFTFGDATPQLIDYAGGGSANGWSSSVPWKTVCESMPCWWPPPPRWFPVSSSCWPIPPPPCRTSPG